MRLAALRQTRSSEPKPFAGWNFAALATYVAFLVAFWGAVAVWVLS